jgi:hypothetical protein
MSSSGGGAAAANATPPKNATPDAHGRPGAHGLGPPHPPTKSAARSHPVELHAYDISGGVARTFAPMLGVPVEAVWHTSIVVRDGHADGEEEVFFGYGVQRARVGTTPFGRPVRTVTLGRTEISREDRAALIADLAERFQPHHYNLVENNCNHFSSVLAELLVGVPAPDEYANQARDLLQSPLGQMFAPFLRQLEGVTGRATAGGFGGGGGR